MSRVIRAIMGKELREIWRDPISLSLALILPLVLLFLFTYGFSFDVPQVRLGVVDFDRSATSRDYLASLTASGDLRIVATAASANELGTWLDQGRIDVGLIVPPEFERTILARQTAAVQVLVDGSYPPQAKAELAMLDAGAASYSVQLVQKLVGSGELAGPMVVPEPRVWYNPSLKSANFIVPGLFSVIVMTFAPLLSTLAIVRERERGSIQQILAAPVSPAAFILGKALPYGLLAFVDLLLILAAGLVWFRIPFRGSLLLFLLAGVVYALAAVATGLLISTLTRSQVTALVLAIMVTLMPSFLFSGFFLPISSMPANYQPLSLAFPARYFTEISQGIILKGAGMGQLWPYYAGLLVLTSLILLVATRRFHRRMA
jgi:ABC-2 type transport system permease protein